MNYLAKCFELIVSLRSKSNLAQLTHLLNSVIPGDLNFSRPGIFK